MKSKKFYSTILSIPWKFYNVTSEFKKKTELTQDVVNYIKLDFLIKTGEKDGIILNIIPLE